MQFRLIAYGLIVLVVLTMGYGIKHLNARLKAKGELVTKLTADIETERANRKTEQEDRQRADDSAASLQAQLDDIRRTPIQPVSVWCRPAAVPGAAAQSGTAASPDGAAGGSGAEGPVRDIGAALADVWREHQSNAARQRALIEWERNRTH